MIKSFKHKGLKRFYEKDDNSRLNIEHVVKIKKILSILDAVEKPEELYVANIPVSSSNREQKRFLCNNSSCQLANNFQV